MNKRVLALVSVLVVMLDGCAWHASARGKVDVHRGAAPPADARAGLRS